MKKALSLMLIVFLLSVSVMANETISADTEQSDNRKILESLAEGIIPVNPDMTYEDLMGYMMVVDNSDNRIITTKLTTLISLISTYYYGDLTVNDVFDLFINSVDSIDINNMDETYNALFSVLDKFSYYLPPEETESFFSPTASKGIGIKMIWKDADGDRPAGTYVDEVADGSPAEEAGIQVGDRIVEFNGNDLRGLGYDALGAYNSQVDPDAETLDITLVRDSDSKEEKKYTIPRAANVFDEHAMTLHPEKNLIYLDINSFMNASTAQEVSADIDVAWSLGYRNIIIDLEDNTGGDVNVASAILSKFLPDPQVLFFMGRDGSKTTIPFISSGNGYKFDKISILVNGGTASSAEIFADTLRRIAGASVIGTKTYGKGVAQSVFTFQDGSACGITSFVVYDRDGSTYNEKGLTPDSKVIPHIELNALPERVPIFTALDYHKAVEGAENSTVLGLEIRLEAIGFLSEEEVDGVWKDATTRAVAALQTYCGHTATGILDDPTYFSIIELVRKFERTYYFTYTAFDYAYRFFPYKK